MIPTQFHNIINMLLGIEGKQLFWDGSSSSSRSGRNLDEEHINFVICGMIAIIAKEGG